MKSVFEGQISVKRFASYVTPSVIMMFIIALYSIVDGIFVANFVGSDALAAIGIVYPPLGLMFGLSIMMATGSSAIVAIKIGEGKKKEADEKFTIITITATMTGFVLTCIGILFLKKIILALGATDKIYEYCMTYGLFMMLSIPFIFAGAIFEFFIRVDGKPGLALLLYVSGGIVNIILDFILVAVLKLGIIGAGIATLSGLAVVALLGLWHFLWDKSNLRFLKAKVDIKYVWDSCVNGFPEMVTESSAGITAIAINLTMLGIAGEDGVAALAIVMYIHYFMVSAYLGYIAGVSPLISYFYGAKRHSSNSLIMRYSKIFILISSITIFLFAEFFAPLIVRSFVNQESSIYGIAVDGFRIVAISFLFIGINIFISGLFTAFGKGSISTTISLSRGFVLVLIGAAIFPFFLQINGIWLILPFAEIVTLLLSYYIVKKHLHRFIL
jgi:Na+-driven multidrug efflux pump